MKPVTLILSFLSQALLLAGAAGPNACASTLNTGQTSLPSKTQLGASCAFGAACQSSMDQMSLALLLPIFISNHDFTSTLTMVNSQLTGTNVNIVLRDSRGNVVVQRHFPINGHSQVQIDIGELLDSAHSDATTGSVEIAPATDGTGIGVTGQISVVYNASSEPSYLEYEPTMPPPNSSQVLHAVAPPTQDSPILGITSVTTVPQKVTIQCIGGSGLPFSKIVTIPASGTIMTSACSNSDADPLLIDPTGIGTSQHLKGRLQPRGIILTTNAPPGSFAAAGIAIHRSEAGTYLTALPFSDPNGSTTSTTIFTGLPVGGATQLPGGIYVPEVSVANFSNSPARITIKYSRTSYDVAQVSTLKSIVVQPHGTAVADFPGLQGDPDLQNSFEVVSDKQPGEVLNEVISKSDTGIRWVELPGKDLETSYNAGNHPWTVTDGTNSTLLLFNETSAAELFTVRIASGKAVWTKKYQIAPLATKAIDINEIIQDEVRDDKGGVLPATLRSGEVNWYEARQFGGAGRLLQSNPAQYAARSFSCDEHGVIIGADWYGNMTSEPAGQSNDFGELDAQVGLTESYGCSGDYVGDGNDYTYSWDTWDSSIAEISFDGSADAYVDGISAGSTGIDGLVSDQYGCQAVFSEGIAITPAISSINPSQGLVGTAINVTIDGAGFSTGTSVDAGSNISVSNVNVVSPTEITATFTPSNSTSAGGNQQVTVTASGEQSGGSQSFLVQYPMHVAYIDTDTTPNNGHSTTTSGTNINIIDYNGNVRASGVCGGYEWLTYDVEDQNGNQITNGTVTITESFSNFSPSPDPFNQPTPDTSSPNLASQIVTDIQAIWWPSPPACPPANTTESFNQQFTATVGSVTYPLTTVVAVAESTNGQGLPSFSVSIATP